MSQFPKTMYKTAFKAIEPVRVVAETARFVTVLYSCPITGEESTWKESKNTAFGRVYFDTWEDAKASLVSNQEEEVKSLRLQLERANGRLGKLRGMKNPGASIVVLPDTCNE